MRAAKKELYHVTQQAKLQCHMSLLNKLSRGDVDLFFHLYKGARESRRSASDNPSLSLQATIDFWQQLFTGPEAHTPVADMEPLVPDASIDITISADDIRKAIDLTDPRAPGHDGLDFLLVRLGKEEVATMLAPAFTSALRHLSDSMRRGKTVPIPKTSPPSSDPSQYRPITGSHPASLQGRGYEATGLGYCPWCVSS